MVWLVDELEMEMMYIVVSVFDMEGVEPHIFWDKEASYRRAFADAGGGAESVKIIEMDHNKDCSNVSTKIWPLDD